MTLDSILEKEEEDISNKLIGHITIKRVSFGNKEIPIIKSKWTFADYFGAIKMRLGIGRFDYKVPPGLYGLGNPKNGDPIFVTANYKYTFDILRRDLKEINCFILVLNTNGINVWCAAGKGTFSSREVIYQIEKNELRKKLTLSKIILPQLGSPAIEPHLIKKMIGIEVIYGPVRSNDIKEFLSRKMIATEEMRQVKFNFFDRLVLGPLEFILNFKFVIFALIMNLIILGSLGNLSLTLVLKMTFPFLIGNIIGAFVFPLSLPILPFKSFSLNGGVLGIIFSLFLYMSPLYFNVFSNLSLFLGYILFINAFIVYISFNFTGCTTFTSVSGVKKEAKYFKKYLKFSLSLASAFILIGIMVNRL